MKFQRLQIPKACFVIVALFLSLNSFSQLTGVKTIPGDYATITLAVNALNTAGVGVGGVIFNVAPGYTETIASTISLTATGTAANPVVFQKDPDAFGANPLITSYTGGTGTPSTALQDGIWRLVGSDYVTIDGINLRDNPANIANPATMEYGYALYKLSISDGCQNVTITNCVITLNKINNDAGTAPMINGSVGILSVNSTFSAATTILVPTNFAGTNSNNIFYSNTIQNCNTGIGVIGFAAASPFVAADQNNDIGGYALSTGNTIINFGGADGAANPATAIRTLAQYELNVSYNIINNNDGAGVNHPNILRGIYINTALSARSFINNNIISVKGGGTTQTLTAIENASGSTAVGNEVNISNNTISNCSYASATTGSFFGIFNTGAPAILNINNNTITNNSTAATATGVFYPIYNNGAATLTININENNINGITFTAATSSPLIGIYNLLGGASSVLSIINNNIQGVVHSALSTSPHTYINNSAATLSQIISSNRFTNLNVNTTGAITFISNSVIVPGTGNQVVDDNSIVGSFTRTNTATSGALTIFNSSATCAAGSVISNSNNDFSNINVSGVATIGGWVNTDAGTSSKTIQGNIFSNWTAGTGAIIVMSINISGTINATVSNLISNISSSGSITGISSIAGNDNIYSNSITNLNSSGTLLTIVTGIAVGSGTTKNIYANTIFGLSGSAITTGSVNGITVAGSSTVNVYDNLINGISANALTTGSVNAIWVSAGAAISVYRNKIYNISSSSAALATGGFVNGIHVTGTSVGAAITLRNNLIGDLKATAANVTEVIRGISLLSTGSPSNIYVYYNTIHLNAVSTGTNFGATGIYHAGNATATIAALDMRNNIIHNVSVQKGTGFVVAYRRSNTSLGNYSNSSNNNLFYAGVPGANTLIFYDGTVSDQTLAAYITRMATRDAASVSEELAVSNKFLSTTGSSTNFLHMDDTKSSAVKSGGANISGIISDFDNDVRHGNAGYSGTGSAPDIGADEYAGITYLPLSGTYNVGDGQTFISLTNAGGLFAKINRVGLSGNVTVNITSDLIELGTEALNEWVETGFGNYTLTIKPSNTTARLISGDVLSGLIRLNGADRVIIDGEGTKALTFRNTNASGTTATAITLINGATNNIIRNSNFEAFTNSTNAVILFSTSANIDGGNSNNLVEFCNVNSTIGSSYGITGILSGGTNIAGYENSNNTISNNNIYDFRETGIEIKSTGSANFNISGNSIYNGRISGGIAYAASTQLYGIRVLGGPGHSVINNFIGGNAASAGGTQAVYNSTGILAFRGILFNSNFGSSDLNIKGNTIANISVSCVPTAASSVVFYGIETNGANINIGGSGPGEGNTIGSNSVNGSVLITTSTTATTNTSLVRGIFCNSQNGWVIGNQVGGVDINNIGTFPGSSIFLGIFVNNGLAPSQVNKNIIGSSGVGAVLNSIRVLSTSKATTTALTGISLGSSVGTAIQVDGNIIKNISYLNTVATVSTGGIIGIVSAAKLTAEVNITNNRFEDNRNSTTMTTGLFYGIQNTGPAGTLRINNNIIKGNNIWSASTGFYAIRNSGAVINTIEINSNVIGDEVTPVLTLNAANSGALFFIHNSAGASTADLSIANNVIQNINYAVNGTGANTYILNSATTLTQSITGNTFKNLNIQTSGNNTFLSNNVVARAAGFQSITNNGIEGTYTKRAGGTIVFLTSAATCAANSTINISNNNFSNVTVTGATVINGLVNTDAGNSNKTIQGNQFTNWSGGTSTLTGITVNLTGTNNATTGNVIRNITGQGTIVGITTAAGNDNIYLNTVDSLYSTAGIASNVTGIAVTAGTTKNIYKNSISNLWGTAMTTGSVRGILVSAGTTVNISQNTISTLYGITNTTGTVTAIWVTAGNNVSVNRNKIYDVSCTGTALTAQIYGIQVSGITVNLTCTINNNIIGDLRTPVLSNADAIRAIGVVSTGAPSTTNVYYNTIYLNASSTGTNFGTTGIFHTVQATATTSALDIRNNSVTNISTPAGSGRTVAYRRSGITLTNYAGTSNNNMFYAGTPGVNNLIFSDGTTFDQTIAAFKTTVSTRETNSITEDLIGGTKYFSTSTVSALYLHLDPNKSNTLRSAGVQIAGFTDDFDGDIRFGNIGYSGSGSSTDIGADEFAGLQIIPFAGEFNVGVGQNYTSLTNSNGLFSKINSLGFSGNVTVNITSDLVETGAEALNQWTETGGSNYNFIIQPDATTSRLISGNAPSGLIRLNGADRVKIDGGAGKYLTFRNTNTSGTTGTAFTFINGATYDTIRNCNIEAFANNTNGVILFSTSVAPSGGNSNIILEHNRINGTVGANTSQTGIYSAGTTGKENANITVTNNRIYDFKDRAIELTITGSTGWTISNNSIYNGNVSKNFNYEASSILHGIRVLGGSAYSIVNNFIGGSDSLVTGVNAVNATTIGQISYKGIVLTTTSATPASNIKGNIIGKITVNTMPQAAGSIAFMGIETSGSGISIGGSSAGEGNVIGSNTLNGSISISTNTSSLVNTSVITGINSLHTGGVITGNQVGGFDITNIGSAPGASAFKGIYVNNVTAPNQVNSNIIGSTGSGAALNSIRVLAASTATSTSLTGIELGSSVASTVLLNRNVVRNISNLSTTSSGSFTGINNTATVSAAVMTITNNLINTINTASNADAGSGVYAGIISTSPSTISTDTVSNILLAATGTAAQVKGIHVSGAFVHSIFNNLLFDFSTSSTKLADAETGTPSGFTITGILNGASVTGQSIYGNTLANFATTTTDNLNTAIVGIGIVTTGNGGNIYGNRLAAFSNNATGVTTLPGITGIMGFNGTYNVYNNVVKMDNSSNVNGVKIYGINHATTNTWNYYYNSIRIGGNSTGNSTRTADFIRTVNGGVLLRNNIFVNERTGTGNHIAISNKVATPATNWAASASNYNGLYTVNPSSSGEWGNGVLNTFAQWKTNSGGDNNSVNNLINFEASPYDLVPSTSGNCVIHNAALPIAAPVSITSDINLVSRNVSTPDMGAYEFNYLPFTVTSGSSSPVCSGTNISLTSTPGTAVSPSYSWSRTDSIGISLLQNANVPAYSGYYTVTVTDIYGCSVKDSTPVVASVMPDATISYPGTPFCPSAGTINVTFSGTTGGTFSSASGLSINSSTGAVNVPAGTPGAYMVTYTIADGGCGQFQTTAPVSLNLPGTWTGAISNDWNNGANWLCGTVPVSTGAVLVPGNLANYPVLNGGSLGASLGLTIASGNSSNASVTVIDNTLKIGGNLINNGTLNALSGTLEFNGVVAQTTTGKINVKDLLISNAGTVSLGDTTSVYNSVDVTNGGTLVSGGFIQIKSSATNTARVADLSDNGGGSITGIVTVERYIIAEGCRAYRLLASSVNTAGSTKPFIRDNWQEGVNKTVAWDVNGLNVLPGFGTHITGSSTGANGFDATPGNAASLFTLNQVSSIQAWVSMPNTHATNLNSKTGYLLYIRGGRDIDLTSGSLPTSNTILRATGTLNTGTVNFTGLEGDGRYSLITNPYASPVSWTKLYEEAGNSTNFENAYYLWDPKIGIRGGYVMVNDIGVKNNFSSDASVDIQSGQAFFIKAKTGVVNPTFTISEKDKSLINNKLVF